MCVYNICHNRNHNTRKRISIQILSILNITCILYSDYKFIYFKMTMTKMLIFNISKNLLFWNAFKFKVYTDEGVVLFIVFIHNSWFHTHRLLCGRISHETAPHNVWQDRNKTLMEIVCSQENCTVYKLSPSEKTTLKI